jgi:death-on-curing protein
VSVREQPRWIEVADVVGLHDRALSETGGHAGLLNETGLFAAVDRPRSWLHYQNADLMTCAAAYGHGLARGHTFVDGNKRTALLAMWAFLRKNGLRMHGSQGTLVEIIQRVAVGTMSLESLSSWLGGNSR